jgi:hypothetical protein
VIANLDPSTVIALSGYYAADDNMEHVIVVTDDGTLASLIDFFYAPDAIGVSQAVLGWLASPNILDVAAYWAPSDSYQHIFFVARTGAVYEISKHADDLHYILGIPIYVPLYGGAAEIAAFFAPINSWSSFPQNVILRCSSCLGGHGGGTQMFFMTSTEDNNTYRAVLTKGNIDGAGHPIAFYSVDQQAKLILSLDIDKVNYFAGLEYGHGVSGTGFPDSKEGGWYTGGFPDFGNMLMSSTQFVTAWGSALDVARLAMGSGHRVSACPERKRRAGRLSADQSHRLLP